MPRAAKDPTRRTPGQYARATVRRLRMRTLVWLGALAVATAALGRTFGLHDWRFLASEMVLLASMFVISHYVLPLLARRDRGASGEEHVGGLLDCFCENRWLVIHDGTVGRGNIDHIVIGPAGIFTVETKSHPGPVRVSRVHGATIEQARAQRRAVERITGIEVEPLIVYSRAWVDRPLARRKGVRLLPARMLLGYLAKCPRRLSGEEIDAAHEQLIQALLEEHGTQPGAGAMARRQRTRPHGARRGGAPSGHAAGLLAAALGVTSGPLGGSVQGVATAAQLNGRELGSAPAGPRRGGRASPPGPPCRRSPRRSSGRWLRPG